MKCRIFNIMVTSILLLASSIAADSTFAQDSDCEKERKIAAHALDEFTWKQLNRVYSDIGEGRYDEAGAALQKMMTRVGHDSYQQAVLAQALAQVEWSRENYDAALAYFERAIELDVLPDAAHFSLMYQSAQIYFMNERYQEALDRLGLWLCKVPTENIPASAYVLQASIYTRKEEYAKALNAIESAISMEEDPKEQWYQLKLAAHYELEQYPQAAETLTTMIYRWPEIKMYWTQLSQIYFKLKQEEDALGVMALAYRRNILDKQADLNYLSNLYSSAGVPYKAAEVLEQGIQDGIVAASQEHWALLADYWYAAEELEKSLAAYEHAGSLASDGRIDLRRGYIMIDLERWSGALAALSDALSKGGLNEYQKGEVYLLRGMARFKLKNFELASSDWGQALGYGHSKDAAQQWINHLQLTLETDRVRAAN